MGGKYTYVLGATGLPVRGPLKANHIDTDERNYLLTGKYKHSQLAGAWSTNDDQKGTWDGKKSALTTSQP